MTNCLGFSHIESSFLGSPKVGWNLMAFACVHRGNMVMLEWCWNEYLPYVYAACRSDMANQDMEWVHPVVLSEWQAIGGKPTLRYYTPCYTYIKVLLSPTACPPQDSPLDFQGLPNPKLATIKGKESWLGPHGKIYLVPGIMFYDIHDPPLPSISKGHQW